VRQPPYGAFAAEIEKRGEEVRAATWRPEIRNPRHRVHSLVAAPRAEGREFVMRVTNRSDKPWPSFSGDRRIYVRYLV
jgi:hypothetical protein